MFRTILNRYPSIKRVIKNGLCVARREPTLAARKLTDQEWHDLIGKEDPIILDIGCNDGGHTLWFLSIFQHAKVYGFEPDLRACAIYRECVQDERATLYEVALSNVDGMADFYVSDGTPPPESSIDLRDGWHRSGSIRKPKNHITRYPWCTFDEVRQIETKRLDTWIIETRLALIDLIWADVQGAEVDLIAGGQHALSCTRYLYTEFNNSELYEGQASLRQLLDLLPDFDVVQRYDHDVLLRNRRFR